METKIDEKELVSIIVPVYNVERYLKDCVKSIQNSVYSKIEIILVDDGSTDYSGAICDQFAESDERIRVIHKKNEGLSAARIDGTKIARGSWIMYVDADDVLSPFALESFSHFFSDVSVDIIAGGRIDLDEPEYYKWQEESVNGYIILSGRETCARMDRDKQQTIITTMWGKVYRRAFFERVELERYKGICPTIFFEDVLMTPILYCAAQKICIIKNVFYIHREVATSISRSMKLSSFFYEQIDSGSILLEFYKSNCLKNMYDYQLDIFYRTILRLYCLIDYEKITDEFRQNMRRKIIAYYKKYYKDYFYAKHVAIHRKIVFLSFCVCPYLWKKTVSFLYYHKK